MGANGPSREETYITPLPRPHRPGELQLPQEGPFGKRAGLGWGSSAGQPQQEAGDQESPDCGRPVKKSQTQQAAGQSSTGARRGPLRSRQKQAAREGQAEGKAGQSSKSPFDA